MTTICASRTEISAESRVTTGNLSYHTDKVFQIGDSIVAVAGDAQNTTKFLAWFRKECPSDEVGMTLDEDHEFGALVLNPRGLFYYSDCVEPDRIHDKFFAIGTGGDAALAAILTAEMLKKPIGTAEAVRIACKVDSRNSGGAVKTLKLPSGSKRRQKPGDRAILATAHLEAETPAPAQEDNQTKG